jgi:hypothetical protein
MSQCMVLTFDQEGTGHCLYGELLDLRAIGALSCQRASHIEFEEESQEWRVLSPDRQRVLFGNASRQVCLDWEQDSLLPE